MSRKDVILLVVALVGAGILFRWVYERGQWKERVNDLTAQVDSTDGYWLKKYAEDSTAWATRSDSLTARGDTLALDSARFARRADTLEARRIAALEELQQLDVDLTTLPQGAQQLVTGLRSALNETTLSLGTCRLRRHTADEQRTVCEVQAADQRDQIFSLEQLRGRLTAERDSALALLRPPSLLSLTLEGGIGPGCTVGLNGMSVCGLSAHVTVIRFRLPLFGGG